MPPGWDNNPTAWPKRIALAAVALVGLLVAGYLTLFQLGVFSSVWDPFFRSEPVLTLLEPFPDAVLGVLAYGTEIVLSFVGGRDRWRTAPWTVLAFGFVIANGAVVSVGLMMVQPLFANAWCTLCLVSAVVSLIIFGWGADEPLAALQHLKRVRKSGGSAWRRCGALTPRKGGTSRVGTPDLRRVGAFFMASPGIFGYGGAAAVNDHVVGPMIFASSLAAAWPAVQSLRRVEVPAGLWMLLSPIFIDYPSLGGDLPDVTHVFGGLAVAIMAALGGKTGESFGGGWSSIVPFLRREARDEL